MGKGEFIEEVVKRVRDVLSKSLCDGFNLYSPDKVSVIRNYSNKKHDAIFEIGVDFNR